MKHSLHAACVGIVLIFLLHLGGCGKELVCLEDLFPDSGTAAPDSPEDPPETTDRWQPLPDYDASIPRAKALTGAEPFVETAHCIVFADSRESVRLKYINKATGEVRVLCGDPLCDHKNDTCAARCDTFTGATLTYVPQTGRLYFARPRGTSFLGGYDIVSVGIDEMELTLRVHVRMKPGDTVNSMNHSGGKLYYTHYTLGGGGSGESDTRTKTTLEELSLSDDKTRTAASAENMGTFVWDGVVYYRDPLYILHACDTASGIHTELCAEEPGADWWFYGGHFLRHAGTRWTMLDLAGNELRELWRHEDIPYGMWTVENEETTYSLAYDPYDIERIVYARDPATGLKKPTPETITNVSGGKLLCWTGGMPEVIADLGERTVIGKYSVIGGVVFIKAVAYDDEGESQNRYCYSVAGKVYELPIGGSEGD